MTAAQSRYLNKLAARLDALLRSIILPMEGNFRSAMPNAALAHCCAAAPDMLAALEAALQDQESMRAPYQNVALCERIRAAVAKATEPQS